MCGARAHVCLYLCVFQCESEFDRVKKCLYKNFFSVERKYYGQMCNNKFCVSVFCNLTLTRRRPINNYKDSLTVFILECLVMNFITLFLKHLVYVRNLS